jgi:hypothetical protein
LSKSCINTTKTSHITMALGQIYFKLNLTPHIHQRIRLWNKLTL